MVSRLLIPGIFWRPDLSIPKASGGSDAGKYCERKKMTVLDTIFQSWYGVFPLDMIGAILSFVFLEEIIYTFTSNWDVVE